MWTKELRAIGLALALGGLFGLARAAEPGKDGEEPKNEPAKAAVKEAKEPPATEPTLTEPGPKATPKEGVVAKVDDVVVTRTDLEAARQLFSMANPQATLNNKQVLEQVVNRILWSKYFDKHNLRPTPTEVQQAVGQLDAELRRRGTTYDNFLATQVLKVGDHLALLNYDLAMRKLVADLQSKVTPEEITAEFNAHTDWYDGSRIRLSQIFVDTTSLTPDSKESAKAKQRIEEIHAQVVAGKDFDRVASDYSDGGGDRGWFARKGAEVDEPLMATVWGMKVGEVTKPILGPRGWQILKVTDREPATLTPFGCKPGILNELTRRRLEALLDELKATAKIESNL